MESKKQEWIVFILGHLINPVLWHFGTEILSLCVDEDFSAKWRVGRFASPREVCGVTLVQDMRFESWLANEQGQTSPEDKELIKGA